MDEILVRELHGLPRRRARGAPTTCGSATRPGTSTTSCTRTRELQDARRYAWLTDFVGWLPMPDGGEREAFLDRRLQRRDDRAHRALSRACATARSSSATPTTSSPTASGPDLPRSATGPSATSTSPATSPASTRRSSPTARRCARSWATRRRAGVRRHRRRLGRRRAAAAARARRACRRRASACPDLRLLVVAGPRIDPATPARGRRARGRGYVARPLPPPRRLRPRRRAGRADDGDGAHRQRSRPFLYVPAAPPLRAAASTCATGSTATERARRSSSPRRAPSAWAR